MKKLLSILLAVAMMATMSVTAFATEVTTNGGSANADVNGTYVAGNAGDVEYSVDISWQGLSFTFNAGGKTWNETTHTYDETEGGWAESNATITVVNHSNAAIVATPTWDAETGFDTVSMKYYNGESEITSLEIASAAPAEGETTGAEQTGVISVKPNGTLPDTANGGKIGQITITITAAPVVEG